MKPPKHLGPELIAIWREVEPTLYGDTPLSMVEAICSQLRTLRGARALIEKDGLVVMDGKNIAMEHPALAIERNAIKQLAELNGKWAVTDG